MMLGVRRGCGREVLERWTGGCSVGRLLMKVFGGCWSGLRWSWWGSVVVLLVTMVGWWYCRGWLDGEWMEGVDSESCVVVE